MNRTEEINAQIAALYEELHLLEREEKRLVSVPLAEKLKNSCWKVDATIDDEEGETPSVHHRHQRIWVESVEVPHGELWAEVFILEWSTNGHSRFYRTSYNRWHFNGDLVASTREEFLRDLDVHIENMKRAVNYPGERGDA